MFHEEHRQWVHETSKCFDCHTNIPKDICIEIVEACIDGKIRFRCPQCQAKYRTNNAKH